MPQVGWRLEQDTMARQPGRTKIRLAFIRSSLVVAIALLLIYDIQININFNFNNSNNALVVPSNSEIIGTSKASNKNEVKHEIPASSLVLNSNKNSYYSTETIASTAKMLMDGSDGRLLVYHPTNDTFLAYSTTSFNGTIEDQCNHCRLVLPMLVNALLEAFPARFRQDQPPFQLLFSDADFSFTKCTSPPDREQMACNATNFAPLLQFGSVFQDDTILPTVRAFPNEHYLSCLKEFSLNTSIQQCNNWVMSYREDLEWSALIPQVVWRGNAYKFLTSNVDIKYFFNQTSIPKASFRPRQEAVRMSIEQEKYNRTWLNIRMARNVRRGGLSPFSMATYKYQIDLGGASGTTWRGTLEKLAMPGLLFHHETPAKDWFYHELKAWKHYVPIRTDLSDLKEKYDWAEANEKRSREISQRATKFARYFFSGNKLRQEYERFFGKHQSHIANIVDSYRSDKGESLQSILNYYQGSHNLKLQHFAECNKEHCFIRIKHGTSKAFAIGSSDCFEVEDLGSPRQTGPVESCFS